MKRLFLIFIFTITAAMYAMPQDSIVNIFVSPEMRTRGELRNGFQKLAPDNSNASLFISQRSRLGIGIETPKIKVRITPQDVRVWGDEKYGSTSGITGDDASLDLFEGYAEIKLKNKNWLSVGRQVIAYDNDWLLSSANWMQSGISSDAVLLKMDFDNFKLHAGSSWNSLKETPFENYYFTNRYKTLNFLWINRAISKSKVSVLHITTGQTKSDTSNNLHFKHTSGLFYTGNLEKLSVNANAYYQYGKNQKGMDVSAFMFYFDMMYPYSNFKIGSSATYFSGNKIVSTQQLVDKNFDLIYTSRHKYMGFIDYFTNIGLHTKQGGLINFAFNIDYKVNKKISLQNSTHYFGLAKTNANTPNETTLGFENDFILKFKHNESYSLETGFMFFVPNESMKIIQNVLAPECSYFAYLQLTVNLGKVNLRKK